MKYYSYDFFKKDVNQLIKNVKEFNPQTIISIARGGLSIAHAMAEGLQIRDVQSIRSELYDSTCKREKISIIGVDVCSLKNSKRVLVVDDIADSGKTLQTIMNILEQKYPHVEFKSATLFYKPTSIYKPTFWINKADDWIDFFWESDFKI